VKIEQRVGALERSAAQHDKQIKAIRSLMQEGMRLMVETRKELRQLAIAQRRTETSLRAYIDSRRGSNGHAKRKVDLQ
jgi:tRNA G26 N,N-dimethylase Trm1